jgi:ribosomal-protein-alanine N-acetyltransferase
MIAITIHGIDGLADVMSVMSRAFDAQFGEAWTAAQCTGVISMPGAQLLIARTPGVAGFALVRTVYDEAELMLLAVCPDIQRQGIGRALLEQSVETARASGTATYFLEVRSDNPARRLYEDLGFEQVGVRREYYLGADGLRRDALTYRLSLR